MDADVIDLPTEVVRPDDEEIQVALAELSAARRALYELQQVQHYDALVVPGYDGYTVGAHLFGPANSTRQVPAGFKLERSIAVCETRVADANARYDALNAREEAWHASRKPKTDEPAA